MQERKSDTFTCPNHRAQLPMLVREKGGFGLPLLMEVMLVISFSETPLASAVLSRGVGGVSPRAIAPVEPRAGSSKRVHRPTRITRDHLARPNAETWRRQGEFCNAELASVR